MSQTSDDFSRARRMADILEGVGAGVRRRPSFREIEEVSIRRAKTNPKGRLVASDKYQDAAADLLRKAKG